VSCRSDKLPPTYWIWTVGAPTDIRLRLPFSVSDSTATRSPTLKKKTSTLRWCFSSILGKRSLCFFSGTSWRPRMAVGDRVWKCQSRRPHWVSNFNNSEVTPNGVSHPIQENGGSGIFQAPVGDPEWQLETAFGSVRVGERIGSPTCHPPSHNCHTWSLIYRTCSPFLIAAVITVNFWC
jgi:hypothetical protein